MTQKKKKHFGLIIFLFSHFLWVFGLNLSLSLTENTKSESKMPKRKNIQFFKNWTYYTFEFHRRYFFNKKLDTYITCYYALFSIEI